MPIPSTQALEDRGLNTILSSGEITNIQMGSVNTTEKVLTQAEVDAKVKVTDDKTVVNAATISEHTVGIHNNTNGIATLDGRVTANEADIAAPTEIAYVPQSTPPAEAEGTSFYDESKHSLSYYTDIPDVTINTALEQVFRCINRSGGTLINGSPVQYVGVDGATNLPMIGLSQADDFTNAKVAGILTHEVLDDGECWVTISGQVGDVVLATVAETGITLAVGERMYLSATEAGKYTNVVPDIAVQIGGFFSGIQGSEPGDLYVYLNGITNLPAITGFLQGQTTPVYASTATPQNIDNYTVEGNIILPVDPVTGIITSYATGVYDFNFSGSFSFTGATQTRSIYISLYNVTGTAEMNHYTIAIPRDATEVGGSFLFPGDTAGPTEFVMQISSSENMDITIEQVSFSVTSKHIR